MNKYLEKIAEETKKDKKKNMGVLAGGVVGLGSTVASMEGARLAQKPIINALDETPTIDRATWKKIIRSNKDLNVTTSVHGAFKDSGPSNAKRDEYRSASGSAGPHYFDKDVAKRFGFGDLKKSVIRMRHPFTGGNVKNTDVGLHELGHAADYRRSSKPVRMAKVYSGIASKLVSTTGAGHLAGGVMLGGEKTKDKAWMAPLIAAAPMVESEAAANYHGYKMLKPHGTAAMKSSFRTLAAKNMLGYMTHPTLGAGSLYLANKLFNKEQK